MPECEPPAALFQDAGLQRLVQRVKKGGIGDGRLKRRCPGAQCGQGDLCSPGGGGQLKHPAQGLIHGRQPHRSQGAHPRRYPRRGAP